MTVRFRKLQKTLRLEMRMAMNGFEPYVEPLYPVGSIVLVAEPTHDFHYDTRNVIGIIYEAYVHKGFKMYAVLFKNSPDCFDMKFIKPSTEHLTEELCCQHLDEHRLTLVDFQLPLDVLKASSVGGNDCQALPLFRTGSQLD